MLLHKQSLTDHEEAWYCQLILLKYILLAVHQQIRQHQNPCQTFSQAHGNEHCLRQLNFHWLILSNSHLMSKGQCWNLRLFSKPHDFWSQKSPLQSLLLLQQQILH